MLNLILTGFLFCFILLLCLGFLCLGIYVGQRMKRHAAAEEPTEEEKRKIEREKREIANFFEYNGDRQ